MHYSEGACSTIVASLYSLIALHSSVFAGAPHYTVHEIESDGIHSYALTDISETGYIGGSAYYSDEFTIEYFAVRVDPDLSVTFLAGYDAEAYGVNNDGEVCGNYTGEPAYWNLSGDVVFLDAIRGPGWGGICYDNLDDGTIVGMSAPVEINSPRATMWIDDEPIDLGLLPDYLSSYAYALTEDRQWVVGECGSFYQGDSLAFLWHDGVMSSLGRLGGEQSVAMDINNTRQVVGWSTIPDDWFPHAFIWQDGVMTALSEPEGTMRSYANQINDYGEVVGRCDADYNSGPTTLWIGQRRYDVNNLLENWNGYDIRGGEAINDRGQIVAYISFVQFVRLDPVFSLFDPEPGVAAESNTLRIFGSEEGNRIVFIYGFQEGSVSVPGCQGLTVDIRNPRLAGTAVANEDGRAQITGIVPGAARGRTTRLQAVDLDACVVTPVFDWTWE